MSEKLICHVCGKEKKPYTIFVNNIDIFSFLQHEDAREKGEICERCDKYHAMTGELKDATEQEFQNAEKSVWFARMMYRWWVREKELVVVKDKDNHILTDLQATEESNKREWGGTIDIARWCRKEMEEK